VRCLGLSPGTNGDGGDATRSRGQAWALPEPQACGKFILNRMALQHQTGEILETATVKVPGAPLGEAKAMSRRISTPNRSQPAFYQSTRGSTQLLCTNSLDITCKVFISTPDTFCRTALRPAMKGGTRSRPRLRLRPLRIGSNQLLVLQSLHIRQIESTDVGAGEKCSWVWVRKWTSAVDFLVHWLLPVDGCWKKYVRLRIKATLPVGCGLVSLRQVRTPFHARMPSRHHTQPPPTPPTPHPPPPRLAPLQYPPSQPSDKVS
jgi:hypothetical protein